MNIEVKKAYIKLLTLQPNERVSYSSYQHDRYFFIITRSWDHGEMGAGETGTPYLLNPCTTK